MIQPAGGSLAASPFQLSTFTNNLNEGPQNHIKFLLQLSSHTDTPTDDTLATLSPEPMRTVKTQSQVIESTREVGSPQCAWKETGSPRNRSECPSMSDVSTVLLGHMSNADPDDRPIISATNSHHPAVLDTYGAATNSKDITIKLHSARCCVSTSLTMQTAASGMSTQFHVTPTEFCLSATESVAQL